MKETSRIRYIDTLKLIAITIIFCTHFINRFNSDYCELWEKAPTSWFLSGVTGKLGVAMFAVALGLFAYKSREKSVLRYTLKRYIFFLISALFINFLYVILGAAGVFEDRYSVKLALVTSITLGADIFRTFWCIRPFFAASVISKINGRYKAGPVIIAAETAVIYLITKDVWVSICLFGNLVSIALDDERIRALCSRRAVRAAVYIAVFFLIKRNESNLTYVIDGICSSMLITALSGSVYIRRALEWEPACRCGQNTMALYLVHVVVYRLVGDFLFGIGPLQNGLYFVFVMAVAWMAAVALSFPVNRMLNCLTALCMKPADRLFERAKAQQNS